MKNAVKGSGSVCEVIERILGAEYLADSARARVNSEIASMFVSRLLLFKSDKEAARDIAMHFIKPPRCANLEEALEESRQFLQFPSDVRGSEALAEDLAEVRSVIEALSEKNAQLMKFALVVHDVCSAPGLSGKRLPKLNLPSLIAPEGSETEWVKPFRAKVGSVYSFLLKMAWASGGGRVVAGVRKRAAEVEADPGSGKKPEVIVLDFDCLLGGVSRVLWSQVGLHGCNGWGPLHPLVLSSSQKP